MSWGGRQQTPAYAYGQAGQGYSYGQQQQQHYGAQAPQAYGQQQQHHYGSQAPNVPRYMPSCPPGADPELWSWFQAVDQDRNGRITVEELQRALVNGNWSPFNEETCRLMVGMFDRDHSGTIDFKEFDALWRYIQEWKRCFDGFDRDRSGTIDVQELHQALQTFGYRLSEEFCRLVVGKFDRHGRGSITLDDFIQACVTLHILTNAFRQKDVNMTGNIRISYEQFLEMVLDTTIRN